MPADDSARFPLLGRGGAIIAFLALINILNFVDRQLPFILIDAIKADLELTDAQIGLMAGLSFAIVYSAAALPLAHIADRSNPRWVLGGSLAVWSGMTALSGFATSFGHLLMARIGVAASEAGCTPAAHALISRTLPAKNRALAIALFTLGVPIGSTLGLALGGWLNDVADWRTAFLVIGLPGLVVAAISLVALPKLPIVNQGRVERPSMRSAIRILFALKSFRYMAIASAFYACGSYAINVFAPAFLMRVHGLSSSQAGLQMGFVFGIGGLLGTFAGGVIADRLARKDEAWRQRVPAIGQWLSIPTALAAWLVPDAGWSVAFLAVSYFSSILYVAPTFAAAQSLVPDNMRATASAVLLSCLTIIGASTGPLAVGWFSDLLIFRFGDLSLRYAMCSMAVTSIASAIFFHLAAGALRDDLGQLNGGVSSVAARL